MSRKFAGLWWACLGVVLAVAPWARAGGNDGPVGSAYLRTLALRDPPFGKRLQDAFPWDGVRVQRWRRDDAPADWLVVWIDLKTPGLGYHVTPVHEREGPHGGKLQAAQAQTTVDFLRTSTAPRVDLAVNTVAFWPPRAADGYWVFLSEPVWQGADTRYDPHPGSFMLGLSPGRAAVSLPGPLREAPPAVALGSFGNNGETPDGLAVRDGKVVPDLPGGPHGRTVAGVSADGRVLILLVADCYNPGVSEGLTLTDAAQILVDAGAHQAIFFDGGGSSTLVGRDDDGEPAVFNRPAGLQNIPGTLRYVVGNLGFTNLRRTDEPLPARTDWEAPWYTVLWAKSFNWVRLHPLRTGLIVVALGLGLVLLWRVRRRRRAARNATAPVSPPSS
jgi:hypothetical protein